MVKIKLENISAHKNGNLIIDNVSMAIGDGEYVGFLGPSGSGPSLLLQVIAGLIPISSGKLLIDGDDMTNKPPEDRHIGFIFEQFNLFPHLNVLGNLLFGPRMRRDDLELKSELAKEMITLVRLDGREDAYPKELSGGMQQRVGIARAVTAGAKILLLDQPYRALDAKIREEMRFEIRQIVKELKLTALHSTHDTDEAMITSDRIAIFNNGRLEQIGSPEDVFQSPASLFVMTFLAESNVFRGNVVNGMVKMGNITLKAEKSDDGEKTIAIRQQSVKLNTTEFQGENCFSATVDKVRVLGEFIRFNLRLDDDTELISRQMLAHKWHTPKQYIGKKLFVMIDPHDVKLFISGDLA